MGIDHSNPYIHSTTVLCDNTIRCHLCHAKDIIMHTDFPED